MKKLKLLFVSIMILSAYNLHSQTLVKETSVNLLGNKEKGAKITLKSFSCENGKVQIGSFIQRNARVDNKKTFKVLKGGYFPAVKLFAFDKDLSNKSVDIKNINLNSYTDGNSEYSLLANKIEEIGNSNTDINYEDLQKEYPKILMPKDTKPESNEYFIELERNVKKKIFEAKFDIISNSIIKTETGIATVKLEYPQTELLRKKFGYGLSNNKTDRFIFASGLYYDKKERKADPTKKWNEFRQYEFNSFDRNGKCLNTFNIDFDYPKIIKYNSKVVTNGKFEGYLYVFGYMPGAKKYNNSETKNKFWAVYFDENGKHIFTKEFESDPATIFYTVHKDNEDLNLFVQGNEYKYGIIKLSKSDYKQLNIDESFLKENTVNGDYASGLKKSYLPIYDNKNVYVLENGSFIIVLENKKTKSVKKGDQTVKITTYNSFALQFDKTGNFKKQYILPVKNSKSKSFSKKYEFITSTSDKLILLSNEAVASYKPKSYSVFYTSNATITKDKQSHLISPVVTVINTTENNVKSASLSAETFYRLSNDIIYCVNQNSNEIYFAGTNKDRNQLVISLIKY